MATAEELLASMSTPGEHIVIDTDRKITVPTPLKRLAVQYDHNIETVTFDCPRYWDGNDMSEMMIYINYARADGYKDTYPAKNIQVDDEVIHFDWTISQNVTFVDGMLEFLVCIKTTDDEGVEVIHWNSEICKDTYISKGMECIESVTDIYEPDFVTYIISRMNTLVNEWLDDRYIDAEEVSF